MSKMIRQSIMYILVMMLGLALISCQNYRSPLSFLEPVDNQEIGEENVDLTTVNMFSAPVPGKPDLVRVVHIFRKEPARPEKGKIPPTGDNVTDYKLTRVKWTHGATYYVQSWTLQDTYIGVNTVFADAFSTWTTAEPAAPIFTNGGTLTGSSYGLNVDGVNTISFGDLSMYGGDVLAVAQYVYTLPTRETIEFDEVYSSKETWTVYPSTSEEYVPGGGSGPFDLPDVATHEHGHVFGLSDLYNTRDRYLTMYGYASAGETLKRTLGKGDILGIQAIY